MSFHHKDQSSTKRQKDSKSSTALTAVAFQDHLIRSLNLGPPVRIGPRQIGLGPAAKQKQKREPRPLIDTGRRRTKPQGESLKTEDKEYVLDAKPQPLTLAQKLGLVEAPDQPLSETDWQKVKIKSNERDDSKLPCVICKEDFGTQEQVLLSCTHVFHRACLQAFERFTGKKTCPMCRKEQYQTRVIHEGSKQHRIKCATQIQAAWRGYVVRTWYKKLRESIPPTDPRLRKQFYANKLSSITDRIVKSCDFNIDVFLTEIDQNLAESRDIFRNFDATYHILSNEQWDDIQLKAIQRENLECPICLGLLMFPGNIGDGVSFPSSTQELHHAMSHMTGAQNKHEQRKSGSHSTKPAPQRNPTPGNVHREGIIRKTVLLSCSHVFHDRCLHSFEELTCEGRPVCPVCRSVYQKRVLSI